MFACRSRDPTVLFLVVSYKARHCTNVSCCMNPRYTLAVILGVYPYLLNSRFLYDFLAARVSRASPTSDYLVHDQSLHTSDYYCSQKTHNAAMSKRKEQPVATSTDGGPKFSRMLAGRQSTVVSAPKSPIANEGFIVRDDPSHANNDDDELRPVQLIGMIEDENGSAMSGNSKVSLVAVEDALRCLEEIDDEIGILDITGRYRGGKSTVLNKLLGKTNGKGFKTGSTIEACTRGLHMWPKPIETFNPKTGKPMKTFLIDSEGIASVDANPEHDTRIFSMGLLIASLFIYNCVGVIDEHNIGTLSMVADVSKFIKVKAAAADGTQAPQQDEDLASHFPWFLWLSRDFAIEMKKNNKELTPDEYLEDSLNEHNAVDPEKKRLRVQLKKYFPTRHFFPLVRPANDEQDLNRMDTLSTSELRPKFVQQLNELREWIIHHVPVKTVDGRPMTGRMMAQYIRNLIKVYNSGQTPVIRDMSAMLSESACRSAKDKARVAWDKLINGSQIYLMSPADIAQTLDRFTEEACDVYKETAFGPMEDEILIELKSVLKLAEKDVYDKSEMHIKTELIKEMDDISKNLTAAKTVEELEKLIKRNNADLNRRFGPSPAIEKLVEEASARYTFVWFRRFFEKNGVIPVEVQTQLEDLGKKVREGDAERNRIARELSKELQEKVTELDEAKTQLQDMKGQYKQLQSEYDGTLERTVKNKEMEIQNLTAEVIAHRERWEAAQAELLESSNTAASSLSVKDARIQDLEFQLAELSEHSSEIETELEDSTRRLNAQLQQLQELEILRLQSEDAEKQISKLKKDLQNVNRDFDDERSAINSRLNAMEEAHDREVQKLQQDYITEKEGLNKQIREYKKVCTDMEKQHKELEQNVAELQTQLREALADDERRNSKTHRDMIALKDENQKLTEANKQLREEHDNKVDSLSLKLKSEIETLKKQAMESADLRMKDKIESSQKLQELEKQLLLAQARLEQELKKREGGDDDKKKRVLNDEINELRLQLATARSRQGEADRAKANSEQQLSFAEDENHKYKKRIRALENELLTLRYEARKRTVSRVTEEP